MQPTELAQRAITESYESGRADGRREAAGDAESQVSVAAIAVMMAAVLRDVAGRLPGSAVAVRDELLSSAKRLDKIGPLGAS